MQFLFLAKAAGIAIRGRQKHQHSGMLHEALPWPVAGGYDWGVQILTAGEGWPSILPQLTDMTYSFTYLPGAGPDGFPTPPIKF